MKEEKFKFKLKGKTLVCIDWASVYGWQENLDWKISADKLIEYLLFYKKFLELISISAPTLRKNLKILLTHYRKKKKKINDFQL